MDELKASDQMMIKEIKKIHRLLVMPQAIFMYVEDEDKGIVLTIEDKQYLILLITHLQTSLHTTSAGNLV